MWGNFAFQAKIYRRDIKRNAGRRMPPVNVDPAAPYRGRRKRSKPAAIAGLIAVLIVIVIALGYEVDQWSMLARARKLKNPVPATPAALADAKPLYQQHCQRCHGANGDGHGEKAPSLSVAPGDFTDTEKMSRVSDGELYWQITHGRLPMPAFKDKIDEKGRWELVDYIRTFTAKGPGATPPQVRQNSAHSNK
jgi:mono/diheme cytochrome c family protein